MGNVSVTREQVRAVLKCLQPGEVLIGGQALAFWSAHYAVSLAAFQLQAGVSKDVDILGDSRTVRAIAEAVGGTAEFIDPQKQVTALVGMVRVASDDAVAEFDVLRMVAGIDNDQLPAFRARALEVSIDGVAVNIMHPIDVLASRFTNLGFSNKQNIQGGAQLKLALVMVGEFLKDVGADDEEAALTYVEDVARICKSAAAKRFRKRFGVSCLPAIPVDMVKNENFRLIRWPRLCDELR